LLFALHLIFHNSQFLIRTIEFSNYDYEQNPECYALQSL